MTIEQSAAEECLRSVFAVLRRAKYGHMFSVPSRPRLLALPYEPVVFTNFMGRGRNVFNFTACPWLYAGMCRATGHATAYRFYQFFVMGHVLSEAWSVRALGADVTKAAIEHGVIETCSAGLRATVRIVPAGEGRFLCTEMVSLDLKQSPARGVYIGRDSFLLKRWIQRRVGARKFNNALDLCCGSGIQAFLCASQSERALGIDIREQAVMWATRNARLNGIENAEFIVSNLFSEVRGSFDLITANFPYDYGQDFGIEPTVNVMSELHRHLRPGGEFFGTTLSWIDRQGKDVLVERLKMLRDVPLDVTLIEAQYTYSYADPYNSDFGGYMKRQGIRKGIQYFIHATPTAGSSLRLSHRRLAWPQALFWNAYVMALRMRDRAQ